jgi:serine/threonine-protein kinase
MAEVPPSSSVAAVSIAGGRYRIGSDDIAEAEAPNPTHWVELSPFRMGLTPVTNEEYDAFVEATGAARPLTSSDPRFGGPRRPVVGVGWDDAVAFCEWAGGALPSEAQWEVAAGGSDPRRYPWGDEDPTEELSHFAQDWNAGGTSEVTSRPRGASPFGCLDMAGNVWEWCADAWRLDAHEHRKGVDPVVRAATNVRPLRGGCWRSIDPKLQCAYRNWFHRVARHVTIAFRVCYSA